MQTILSEVLPGVRVGLTLEQGVLCASVMSVTVLELGHRGAQTRRRSTLEMRTQAMAVTGKVRLIVGDHGVVT